MSSFVLELVIDRIVCLKAVLEGAADNDVRLSISLLDFPVVHIAPHTKSTNLRSVVGSEGSTQEILFNGAGKLCEFTMSKTMIGSGNITLLLLKEITTLNDHLILAITHPIGIQELLLSLPSGNTAPFAQRTVHFIDNKGYCEVRIRLTKKQKQPDKLQSRPAKPAVKAMHAVKPVLRDVDPVPIVKADMKPEEPISQQSHSPSTSYGGFRKRNSLIR
jgi:hypothetical protein